jgi:hypothetical protein
MLWRRLVVLMMLMGSAVSALAAPREQGGAVSIRIHDYSNFEDQQLQQAQRQVSETYAGIGVDLEWRQVVRPAAIEQGLANWPPDRPATITIVVLATAMAMRLRIRDDVAGYAPITREHGGRIAFVVGDRTRAIAAAGRVAQSEVLGGIIAHELAHLLMPARSHSPEGVMRAQWDPSEFRQMRSKGFSKDEALSIRETVRGMAGGSPRVAD